jgi:hypothetical protein
VPRTRGITWATIVFVAFLAAGLAGLVVWGMVNRWLYAGAEGYGDGIPIQTIVGVITVAVIASVALPLRWLAQGKRRAAVGLILWFLLTPVALFFFGALLFAYSSANS